MRPIDADALGFDISLGPVSEETRYLVRQICKGVEIMIKNAPYVGCRAGGSLPCLRILHAAGGWRRLPLQGVGHGLLRAALRCHHILLRGWETEG